MSDASETGSSAPEFDPRDFEPSAVEATALPAVVAVVITEGGPTLERSLAAVCASEYPSLTVLVVDHGPSVDDTLVGRIAAIGPQVLVRRVGAELADLEPADRVLAAANDAIASVSGAPLLLVVRDDIVVAPDAIRTMVEEVYRSNAAIVGPKLVDADDTGLLVDVGGVIDHFGTQFSPIEPGERDQEQHDAVRDVFFVSSPMFMVRADIFAALAGFAVEAGPAADVDLCWRARLLGGRVLVAPDAVGAVVAGAAPRRTPSATPRVAMRTRLRVLGKNYGVGRLAWVIPTAFVFSLAEAFAHVLRRRPHRARALVGAWFDAFGEIGSVRAARRPVQEARIIDDAEVTPLMLRGNARARELFTRRLHVDDRIAEASVFAREAIDDAGRFRNGEYLVFAVLVLLLLVGVRGFVTGSVPSVGGMVRWPSVGLMAKSFFTVQRHALLGAQYPSPVITGIAAMFGAIGFGHVDLVRMLIVVGAGPLGAVGAYRLTRSLAPRGWAGVASAVAYCASTMNSTSQFYPPKTKTPKSPSYGRLWITASAKCNCLKWFWPLTPRCALAGSCSDVSRALPTSC